MKTFDDFKPLNNEEYAIIDKVVEIINAKTAIPCTNCKYCEEACPLDIPSGDYFMLYNDYYRMTQSSDYNDVCTPAITYGFMKERRTGADKCVACGKCEKVCPQHIPIIENLREKVAGELYSHNPDSMLDNKVENLE